MYAEARYDKPRAYPFSRYRWLLSSNDMAGRIENEGQNFSIVLKCLIAKSSINRNLLKRDTDVFLAVVR